MCIFIKTFVHSSVFTVEHKMEIILNLLNKLTLICARYCVQYRFESRGTFKSIYLSCRRRWFLQFITNHPLKWAFFMCIKCIFLFFSFLFKLHSIHGDAILCMTCNIIILKISIHHINITLREKKWKMKAMWPISQHHHAIHHDFHLHS